jgi:cytochrome c-type biogenesis protein CcmH
MTMFWIMAAGLVVVALLFVLLPVLKQSKRAASASRSEANVSIYRDQLRELDADLAADRVDAVQYQKTRNELEKRLLEDAQQAAEPVISAPTSGKKMAIAAVIAVPILTVGLYFGLGKPEGLNVGSGEQAPHPITPAQIESMVEKLAARMKDNPADLDGWMMLGRSYGTLQRFVDATKAYEHALNLMPKDMPPQKRAQLMIDYADVFAMTREERLQGEPAQFVLKAIKLDPTNLKGLLMAGTAAFQGKDYTAAIKWWQTAEKLVPADSEIATRLKTSVAQAQEQMGQSLPKGALPANHPPMPSQAEQQAAAAPANPNAVVSGRVSLEAALKAKASPTDTVFIFARDADQPRRPPLAILRKTVQDLPLNFTLDDSMGIMPMFKLSSASKVVVGARVSKTGNAMPTAGDLQGFAPPSKLGAKGLNITINAEVH